MIRRALAAVAVVIACSSSAGAQDGDTPDDEAIERARGLYERGRELAEQGDLEAALAAFEEGYRLSKRPKFLFNSAECARAMGATERARRLYRAFLRASPDGELADLARRWLASLGADESPEAEPSASDDGALAQPSPAPDEAATPSDGDESMRVARGPDRHPLLALPLFAQADVGAAFYDLGEVSTSTALVLRGTIGVPLTVGPLRLRAGATLSSASMRYRGEPDADSRFTFAGARASAGYAFADRYLVAFDASAGYLWWTGLGDGNPFVTDSRSVGTIGGVAGSVGVELGVRITDALEARITPLQLGVSEKHSELARDIKRVVHRSSMAGLSYEL